MRFGYLIVEGPHDAAFVGRLLRLRGLRRVRKMETLQNFWDVLIPKTFPHEGDLLKRMPVPTFFQDQGSWSVAVQSAVGDSKLASTLQEDLIALDEHPEWIGMFLDADTGELHVAQERFDAICEELRARGFQFPALAAPGEICPGVCFEEFSTFRMGIFVLPDNASEGTLEDILLECAQLNYPTLFQAASEFIDNVDLQSPEFNKRDRQDFKKPSGRKKAVVACISNVLRPGKSIQVSLQDNRWIDEDTLNLTRVEACAEFLEALFGISPPESATEPTRA